MIQPPFGPGRHFGTFAVSCERIQFWKQYLPMVALTTQRLIGMIACMSLMP